MSARSPHRPASGITRATAVTVISVTAAAASDETAIGALAIVAVLTAGAGGAANGPAPERRDIVLSPDGHTVSGTVPRDATLETILRSHDVDPATAAALVTAMAPVFNPRQLRADQRYEVTRADDGQLRELRYEIDATKYLRVVRADAPGVDADGPEFTVKVLEYPREVQVSVASASLSKTRTSLSAALDWVKTA